MFKLRLSDTIDSSGHPLGFRVSASSGSSDVLSGRAGQEVFRVEARAMSAHQKEAVVTQGAEGSAWRMVSDEGAYLNGSDLAPFPLGFFNAGLQSDVLNWISRYAEAHSVQIDDLALELDNLFAFRGSFFKGTGQGIAEPIQVRVRISSSASASAVARIVRAALRASPALAAVRVPLKNTFALYVNGKRRAVTGSHASPAHDAADPYKIHHRAPRPLAAPGDLSDLVTKIPHAVGATQVMPASGTRVELAVGGRGRIEKPLGAAITETWLERPAGSYFGLKTDERTDRGRAPSGLALQSAGISFCYMTQLIRYAEYLKYKVSAIRMVQFNPYHLSGRIDDWTLEAGVGPVDTHLFLNGDEPDEVMQKLLTMGAQTCYLHASLSSGHAPVASLELNGEAVPLDS